MFSQGLTQEIPELQGGLTIITAWASRQTCRGMAKSAVLPQYALSTDRLALATSESALCPGRLAGKRSHYEEMVCVCRAVRSDQSLPAFQNAQVVSLQAGYCSAAGKKLLSR